MWKTLLLAGVFSFILRQGGLTASVSSDVDTKSPKDRNQVKNSVTHSKYHTGEGLIPTNYSPFIPPPSIDGKPTQVNFSVVIMNVRDIMETTQEISIEMNLRVFWLDSRLKNLTGDNEYLVLNPSLIEKNIWRPDVFVDHVKSVPVPYLMSKPASLRVFSDGNVRYSARVTIQLSCSMNFRFFPADTQKCNIDLKSYAYPETILVLGWQDISASFVEGLVLANYDLGLASLKEPFSVVSASGSYSCIRFTVTLRRKITYHLIQTYFPSALFIVVSWLNMLMCLKIAEMSCVRNFHSAWTTFLVPQSSGAVLLCMTCMLTITTMFSSVRTNTPNVSYVKALDIWMVFCMFFVFIVMAHHAITLKLRNIKLKKPRAKNPVLSDRCVQNNTTADNSSDGPNNINVSYRLHGKVSLQMKNMNNKDEQVQGNHWNSNNPIQPPSIGIQQEDPMIKVKNAEILEYRRIGNEIRQRLRLATPILFILFNCIYWPWILFASGYYDP